MMAGVLSPRALERLTLPAEKLINGMSGDWFGRARACGESFHDAADGFGEYLSGSGRACADSNCLVVGRAINGESFRAKGEDAFVSAPRHEFFFRPGRGEFEPDVRAGDRVTRQGDGEEVTDQGGPLLQFNAVSRQDVVGFKAR